MPSPWVNYENTKRKTIPEIDAHFTFKLVGLITMVVVIKNETKLLSK